LLLILSFSVSQASLLQVSEDVWYVKGWANRWFVWDIIATIFNPGWKITSEYVMGFQNIYNANNNIPRWDGRLGFKLFQPGIITDDGTELQIGGDVNISGDTNITWDTVIDGNITADNYYNSSWDNVTGKFREASIAWNIYYDEWNVWIGTNYPQALLDIDGDIKINGITVWRWGINSNNSTNTAFGISSLRSENVTNGWYNTAFGYNSQYSNEIGRFNVWVWPNALYSWTEASSNIWVWFNTLYSSTIWWANVAIGTRALEDNTTWAWGVAIGHLTLDSSTTWYGNTWVWSSVMRTVSTGEFNTAVWYMAGNNISTGTRNVTLWYLTNVPDPAGSNQLNIANKIYGLWNGNIGIGTSAPQGLLDIKNGVIFTGITSVDSWPDILFSGRGLVASESKFSINIDSNNDNTDANFSIRANWNTQSAANVFTVFENWNVQASGKITMQTPTQGTDLPNVVATKGYVDNSSSISSTQITWQISSRNISTALNVTSDVTYYAADQDTANFLCREQVWLQFGYWRSKWTPNSSGWAPYSNLEISAFSTDSQYWYKRLCTSWSDCYNKKTQYGGNLYCYSINSLPAPIGY